MATVLLATQLQVTHSRAWLRLLDSSQNSGRSCPFLCLEVAEHAELSEIILKIRMGWMLTEVPATRHVPLSSQKNCALHRRRSSTFPQSYFPSCCTKFPPLQLSEEVLLQGFIIFYVFGIVTEAVPGFQLSV